MQLDQGPQGDSYSFNMVRRALVDAVAGFRRNLVLMVRVVRTAT